MEVKTKLDWPSIRVDLPQFEGTMLLEIVCISGDSVRTYSKEFQGKLSEPNSYQALVPLTRIELI